jgi:hypothetical protein
MDVAAIIVAIVAIMVGALLAGFGILIQFLTHKATTEQSERVADSVAQFRADMQGLVSEVKGITDTLVGVQREQFNRMLDAFVTRPEAAGEAADRATESAATAQEVGRMLEALREDVANLTRPGSLPERLEALDRRLEEIRQSSAAAARFADAASRRGFARRYGKVTVHPSVVSRGGRVTIQALPVVAPRHVVYSECTVARGKKQWTAIEEAEGSGEPRSLEWVFPGDFPGASTEEPGTYWVWTTLGTGWNRNQPLEDASFQVIQSDASEATE